jgi:hypothetical protein
MDLHVHLTTQTLTVTGISSLAIPAFIIGVWGLYYRLQASNNLKTDSRRRGWSQLVKGPIPRSEFTELGLWYRRRAFIFSLVLAAWALVIVSFWTFAVWLTS